MHRARRLALGAIPAALLVLLPAPSASALHGAEAPGGPYDGFATGTVFRADAATTVQSRLADLEVGLASVSVDSQGLRAIQTRGRRPLLPDLPIADGAPRSAAHSGASSSIIEAGVGLTPPHAASQIRPSTAAMFAPQDAQPVRRSLLTQRVGSTLFADILANQARARWNGSSCVVGEPIASAAEHVARLDIFETKDDPLSEPEEGFDAPLASLGANSGGPRRALTRVTSLEQLFKGKGQGLGLMSVTATTLAPVTFFGGTPNEFTVEVDGPAFLVARADGTPGGASVAFRAPVVSLVRNGEVQQVFPTQPVTIRVPDSGDILARVKVGVLDPLAAPEGLGDATQTADGLRAAAEANVVEVVLLEAANPAFHGATIALGHMEGAARVPAGGITCPLPVTKSADPPSVSVGKSFDTTITVHNPFACPVRDVVLTDDVSIEQAARFRADDAAPTTPLPGGSGLEVGSMRWDLGTIAPGASKKVVVGMTAQNGAGKILDTATASGTLENCPVEPASEGVDVTSLAEATVDVTGSGSLVVPVSQVLGVRVRRGVLPQTGIAGEGALGLVLLALAAVLARRAVRQ